MEEHARLRLDLAHADEVLAEEELVLALAGSQTGSVGRLTDVQSIEGNSAGAQRDATTDLPLIEFNVSAETRVAFGLPVKT